MKWPATAVEELPWQPTSTVGLSRTQQRKHRGPYKAAILEPIAALPGLALSDETLAEADDASHAAARFDAEFGTEILPFASLMLRSESAASSQVENLTASARTVALAELGDATRQNGSIIVANVRAMAAALELSGRIDADSVIAMHRSLLETSQPDIVGQWRTAQVWIGGSGAGPHQALFVPPHHRHVAAAMDDLVAFIDRDDLPVLAHAAVAHAQFETIHPFPDGNGRTGRALVHAMLVGNGLVQNVTVPFSAGILTDVDAYFDALTAYRRGDTNPIVSRMAHATLRAVANGTELLTNLQAKRAAWGHSIVARSDSAVWRILDLSLRHPVVDSNLLRTELNVTVKTALDSVERLVTEGALKPVGTARRNRKWEAPWVLRELDAFAERAGRRAPSS